MTIPLESALLTAALLACSLHAVACSGAPAAREATAAEIAEFVKSESKTVLTFAGYSGAGYENPAAVLAHARDALARRVDVVFYVQDATWGGTTPETGKLSPASEAIVAVSETLVGIGGGEIAREEMLAARKAGKTVVFVPADINHRAARDKSRQKGRNRPERFPRGGACRVRPRLLIAL